QGYILIWSSEHSLRILSLRQTRYGSESSWQIRHDFNFGKFNLPDLNLMNRYIYGNGIENSQTKDGREHGFETEISYTIKTGWLKSLSIKARHSEIRRNWGNTNSFNDNRLILSYTIPVFN
ncbi:OprD family outer membrane porin, partial [Acinetobacter baumannii]